MCFSLIRPQFMFTFVMWLKVCSWSWWWLLLMYEIIYWCLNFFFLCVLQDVVFFHVILFFFLMHAVVSRGAVSSALATHLLSNQSILKKSLRLQGKNSTILSINANNTNFETKNSKFLNSFLAPGIKTHNYWYCLGPFGS